MTIRGRNASPARDPQTEDGQRALPSADLPLRVVAMGHRFDDLSVEQRILSPVAAVVDAFPRTEEELIIAAHGADGILNQLCQLTPRVITGLERCRVIAVYGVGVDSVDVAAATTRGIQVCNVPDYCTEEVAVHTLALLLSFERRIPQMMAHLEGGHWDAPRRYAIHRLTGRSLDLLGFGRIARRVAVLGQALGLRVLTHDPFVPPEDVAAVAAEWLPQMTLLSQSDYLSIHIPLTPATSGLLGPAELAVMRPGAILINTSRGNVFQEAALVTALRNGRIRGAALDVFVEEPIPPSNPLLNMENVIITPHMAWYSEEAETDVRQQAAAEVRRVLTGATPTHPVNQVGARPCE
jgi:D-3-phosphoglycerate dehydrogenase